MPADLSQLPKMLTFTTRIQSLSLLRKSGQYSLLHGVALVTPICWQNLSSGFAFHHLCFFLRTIAESGSTFLSSCFHLISTWIHENKSDLTAQLLCSLFYSLSPFLCISWALLMVAWGWDMHLARGPKRTQEVQRGLLPWRSPCKGE